MSVIKPLTVAATLVAALTTCANAATTHHHIRGERMMVTQPAYGLAYGTLPYGIREGVPTAGRLDANTRAAEAFQDHFRNY